MLTDQGIWLAVFICLSSLMLGENTPYCVHTVGAAIKFRIRTEQFEFGP